MRKRTYNQGKNFCVGFLYNFLFSLGSDCCQEDDLPCDVQVVGMSATLPNLEMLASWLNADLYITGYRPVPLIETMKVGKTIYDVDMRKVSEINSEDIVSGDEEHVIPLCLETIRECHSLLIFCPTKQWCEQLAKSIAENIKHLLSKGNVQESGRDVKQCPTRNTRSDVLDADAIAEVIEQLRRSPVGLDKTLADVVSSGVSFHHAGLTFDERDVIEGAFRRGAIRVLVATSTLSSGMLNHYSFASPLISSNIVYVGCNACKTVFSASFVIIVDNLGYWI